VDVTLIDGHNDLPWAYRELCGLDAEQADLAEPQPRLQTDLPRLSAGGVKGQFWSVYVPSTLPEPQAVVATMEQIDLVHKMIARYDRLDFATSADEIESVVARGRLASLLGIEGGHSISSSLGVLRQLYRLGARYMTLTHNESTAWADSATDDPVAGGLSDFGREVVAEMNCLGMMVDLSHVADTTMRDALDATSAPVIFSHSNARAVCDVARNVPDDVLARVPDNGGVVMATFVPFFVSRPAAQWMRQALESARRAEGSPGIGPYQAMREHARAHRPPAVTIDDVVAQFDYLRNVVGVDHVGIGGDFDGNDFVTLGLEDVASYPRLFDALRARGWSAAELDQVAGRNLLRVMRDVESIARQ
jgi:membrane dipeptidase